MDPIEKAIRNAFEKGNADDRAFRERVYRSAFAALDKAIKANPAMTVEAAIRRRKSLQEKVAEIESEFLPAIAVPVVEPNVTPRNPTDLPPAVSPPPAPSRPAAPQPLQSGRLEPSIDSADPVLSGPIPSVAPDGDYPQSTNAARRPGPAGNSTLSVDPDGNPARARRRRRPYAALFMLVTLIVAAGIGAWWASQTGLFLSSAERDTSVPNPPQTSEPEDFAPEEEAAPEAAGVADPDRNWVGVFSPSDLGSVSTPGNSKAEVMQDDSGPFLRISSGQSGATVLFDIGQGVLDQLAGKLATFDIVARGGESVEMSIDCNFGNLGDCGRKRYTVGIERADFLFEIQFPNESPGAAGTIAINPDVSGSGKSVDIYAIRVSAAQ